MLQIDRHVGESVFITAPDGTVLVLTVARVSRGKVRLDCHAPKAFKIDRQACAAPVKRPAVGVCGKLTAG